MASSLFFFFFFLLLIVSTTATSETCKTQKFKTQNKTFNNCISLPHLSSFLHYTFNKSSSTLTMAFSASPSNPSGWISWGINPTAEGMSGADTLIGYINSSSSTVVVSTFHLQSYHNISQVSPPSVNVSEISGESSSDGKITVFGTWRITGNASAVNMIWQVGPSVGSKGFPAKHDFKEDNLQAKSKLELTTAPAPAAAPASGKNAAGEGLGRVGFFMGLVLGAFLFFVMLL